MRGRGCWKRAESGTDSEATESETESEMVTKRVMKRSQRAERDQPNSSRGPFRSNHRENGAQQLRMQRGDSRSRMYCAQPQDARESMPRRDPEEPVQPAGPADPAISTWMRFRFQRNRDAANLENPLVAAVESVQSNSVDCNSEESVEQNRES